MRAVTVARCVLVASALCIVRPAAADECWQLASPGLTVVACGRADAATAIADQISVTQKVMSWMLAPAAPRASPVLALSLPMGMIDRYFGRDLAGASGSLGRRESVAQLYALPQSTVALFTPGPDGQEFDALRDAYAVGLMASAGVRRWPACVKAGVTTSLSTLRVVGRRAQLPLDVGFPYALWQEPGVFRSGKPLLPIDRFLGATAVDEGNVALRNRAGLSCFLLARMAISAESDERAAFGRYFELVGTGVPLADATRQAFGFEQAVLDERLLAFGARVRADPSRFDLWVDLGNESAARVVPERIQPDRMDALLTVLRARMFGGAVSPAEPAGVGTAPK